MESKFKHKVLIVDNDDQAATAIGSILKAEKIEYTFVSSGKFALDEIKKTQFSLIICDHHLIDMQGIEILEQAKKISQISIRFLMADYSQIETIIDAVNKDSIQRYIVKPIDHEGLKKIIKSAVCSLEDFLENKKLFKIAKQQNTRLYELDCELMEQTTSNNKEILKLNQDIEKLTRQIKTMYSPGKSNKIPVKLIDEIEKFIKSSDKLDLKKTTGLLADTIKHLHGEFRKIAHKNSFEMPDIEKR